MRSLIVLCASICCFGTSALAQDATDAERLNSAPFVTKPFTDPTHMLSLPDNPAGVLRFGKLAIVPTYSLERTAESWRIPESGQNVTTQELQLRAYLLDHPIFRIGVRAIMRSGRHKEIDPQEPAAYNLHFGHEPNDQRLMIDLTQLFGSKK